MGREVRLLAVRFLVLVVHCTRCRLAVVLVVERGIVCRKRAGGSEVYRFRSWMCDSDLRKGERAAQKAKWLNGMVLRHQVRVGERGLATMQQGQGSCSVQTVAKRGGGRGWREEESGGCKGGDDDSGGVVYGA